MTKTFILDNNGIRIQFDEERNQLIEFSHNTIDIRQLFKKWMDSSITDSELKDNIHNLFDILIECQKIHILAAAHAASRIFEATKLHNFLKKTPTGDIISVPLWFIILEIIWVFEDSTNRIHKGTAYFYGAEHAISTNDIDSGFNYLNLAIQEDKYLEETLPDYLKTAPAYYTISLIDTTKNKLYWFVKELLLILDRFISTYQLNFNKNFNYNILKTKFLDNDDLEVIRFYFVFIFAKFNKFLNTYSEKLIQNDFNNLLGIDIIFGFGKVLDILISPLDQKDFNRNIVKMCEDKKWSTQFYIDQLNRIYKLNKPEFSKQFKNIINLTSVPNHNQIHSKEAALLAAAKNLRNLSGHSLEHRNLISKDLEIIGSIMIQSIFLVLDYMY